MPPRLSSLRPLLFVYGGPSCDVFCFHRLFMGIIFFSFSLFFGPEAAAAKRPPPVLRQLPGRRLFLWPALLSPPSFLFCLRSLLRPFGSVLSRLLSPPPVPLLHASPFPSLLAPFPLFLSLFTSSLSPFLPIPPHTHPHTPHAYLSFGSLAATDSKPPSPRPQIIKIPSQGAKPRRRAPEGGERAGAAAAAGSPSAVRSQRRPPGSRPESSLQ